MESGLFPVNALTLPFIQPSSTSFHKSDLSMSPLACPRLHYRAPRTTRTRSDAAVFSSLGLVPVGSGGNLEVGLCDWFAQGTCAKGLAMALLPLLDSPHSFMVSSEREWSWFSPLKRRVLEIRGWSGGGRRLCSETALLLRKMTLNSLTSRSALKNNRDQLT